MRRITDKERLDWLQQNVRLQVLACSNKLGKHAWTKASSLRSVRAAIDAAIRQQRKERDK